ncbi:unnamed protein product, partial [Urochloa humidicola]
ATTLSPHLTISGEWRAVVAVRGGARQGARANTARRAAAVATRASAPRRRRRMGLPARSYRRASAARRRRPAELPAHGPARPGGGGARGLPMRGQVARRMGRGWPLARFGEEIRLQEEDYVMQGKMHETEMEF